MKKNRSSPILRLLSKSFLAAGLVAAVTMLLLMIGRDILGEAVISLLFLVPVAWSAARWGLVPGISAAITAALCFDFFFIPPFNTLTVGSLEGWLVLVIFMGVAILVVERIQVSQTRAREAVFMYELSASLADQHTPDAVADTVAQHIQQLFQASLVKLIYQPKKTSPSIVVYHPAGVTALGQPDRTIPLLNYLELIGEIRIWRGDFSELPPEDSRILKNFASQAVRAFERTHTTGAEDLTRHLTPRISGK